MARRACLFLIVLVSISISALFSVAQENGAKQKSESKPVSISEKTKSMQRYDGFVPFYWDEQQGKIWIEISDFGAEFLYVHSLATGLGSNPVGLDRGQLGGQKVVHFRRVGPKIFLIQRNLRFRANTENDLEKQAVQQSFAQSIIWGGKVGAEENGKILVDITSLLMTDTHGVTRTLARTGQGDFKLDANRSAVFLPRCKSFPDNTEFEATLTFAGQKPGRHVQQTTPTPQSVTLRQHHSFVKLPDNGYRPREYDVRCPSMSITFADYATPINSSLQKQWILRHRLVKKDPAAKISEPVEPIIYYVDSGAPKQIADALVEGASWWNDAFEAAGFKNAFQVKIMPADADPMDVRYNLIQWVHRSTRGWSYGNSVIDPRTGEIIKGHVSLGSLRVRQDRLLFEGLDQTLAALAAGGASPQQQPANCGLAGVPGEGTLALLSSQRGKNAPVEIALARIRQLSAHEVGHTLGFVHNFAASTYGDRASVMDYPAPRIKIVGDGTLDFSDAYGVGIGSWDKIAVQYAYTQFEDGADEQQALDNILDQARAKKMLFISDADARPAHASHAFANLWDNGSDPIAELEHVMHVRKLALEKFDPQKLPARTSTYDIQQHFVPVYLHHRYQVQAVAKLVGGYEYQYGYAEEGFQKKAVSADVQKKAVKALLDCISQENLIVRDDIFQAISPQPQSTIGSIENFESRTGRNFDSLEPARIAIDLVMSELFQAERLNRLTEPKNGLSPKYLFAMLAQSIFKPSDAATNLQIRNMKQLALVEHLIKVTDHPRSSTATASAAHYALLNLPIMLGRSNEPIEFAIRRKIDQFLNRPHAVAPEPTAKAVPPGSPIGDGQ